MWSPTKSPRCGRPRRRVLRYDNFQERLNIATIPLVAGAILRVPSVDGDPQMLPTGAQALRPPIGPPRALLGFGSRPLPLL